MSSCAPPAHHDEPGNFIHRNIFGRHGTLGGTGRSMAVANIAWILASNGKRLLAGSSEGTTP